MNRTQKNAWFGLVNCLLALAFCIFFILMLTAVPEPGFKSQPQPSQTELFIKIILRLWPVVLPVIALVLLLLPRKKQSPAEPDFDELDAVIQNKATRISFITVWFLWPPILFLIMLTAGITAPFPALIFFCFFICAIVFIACMTIYFLTKIILYRNQTEGETA